MAWKTFMNHAAIEFEDKNGYNPLKMVQITPKHVGVIVL
jgi:hypothetical protein